MKKVLFYALAIAVIANIATIGTVHVLMTSFWYLSILVVAIAAFGIAALRQAILNQVW